MKNLILFYFSLLIWLWEKIIIFELLTAEQNGLKTLLIIPYISIKRTLKKLRPISLFSLFENRRFLIWSSNRHSSGILPCVTSGKHHLLHYYGKVGLMDLKKNDLNKVRKYSNICGFIGECFPINGNIEFQNYCGWISLLTTQNVKFLSYSSFLYSVNTL